MMMGQNKQLRRRDFAGEALLKTGRWCPLLGLLGFRFHAYINPIGTGWNGWITWCGKLVGFVARNGSIRVWP